MLHDGPRAGVEHGLNGFILRNGSTDIRGKIGQAGSFGQSGLGPFAFCDVSGKSAHDLTIRAVEA